MRAVVVKLPKGAAHCGRTWQVPTLVGLFYEGGQVLEKARGGLQGQGGVCARTARGGMLKGVRCRRVTHLAFAKRCSQLALAQLVQSSCPGSV